MSDRFGNNRGDDYTAKPYVYTPAWEKDVDYNPDHRPSDSDMFIEGRGDDVMCVLAVQGLGAVLFRVSVGATKADRQFHGMSLFTDAEIGHRK